MRSFIEAVLSEVTLVQLCAESHDESCVCLWPVTSSAPFLSPGPGDLNEVFLGDYGSLSAESVCGLCVGQEAMSCGGSDLWFLR